MLSRFVIAFLPRRNRLLISWLQSLSVVISEPKTRAFIKRLFSSSLLSANNDGVIRISEIIDISPGNLDSSLCFIQPGISQDVLCIC